MRQYELDHAKDWQLRDWLRKAKLALSYAQTRIGQGLNRLVAESLITDIELIECEIRRRKEERAARERKE